RGRLSPGLVQGDTKALGIRPRLFHILPARTIISTKTFTPASQISNHTAMLLTHGILSAYLLSTFVTTATPIPTLPHLLPRLLESDLLSDVLSTRGTAGMLKFQMIPFLLNFDTFDQPAFYLLYRFAILWRSPRNEARNVHEAPRPSSKLEVRMADNDSHVAFQWQGLSAELVKYLHMPVDNASNIENSAAAAKKLALNLGNLKDPDVIKQVAQFLIWFRNP
ncbi:hypothetical protein H0H93_010701, partial [Arthromyces matolae]